MSDLTVVMAATAGTYKRWADRLAASIRQFSPDVPVVIFPFEAQPRRGERFGCLLESATPYTLHLDADSVATADVRPLVALLEDSGKRILSTASASDTRPGWRNDYYTKMFTDAGLTPRWMIPLHFLIETALAHQLVARFRHWIDYAIAYRPAPFPREHQNYREAYMMALALSEAGNGDDDTLYVGRDIFSYRSPPNTCGIIHHYTAMSYRPLERDGKLQTEIERRQRARQ